MRSFPSYFFTGGGRLFFPVDGAAVLTNCESWAQPSFEIFPPLLPWRDGAGDDGMVFGGVFGGMLLLVAMRESKVVDEKIYMLK